MGYRCKVIVDYPYEGEKTTLEDIQKEEHEAIMSGELSFEDIISAGGAIVEVLASETVEA